jgi:hypothetical protein
VLAASTIRAMMEAASGSETSVNFYETTQCSNPEDGHLQHCVVQPKTCRIFLMTFFNYCDLINLRHLGYRAIVAIRENVETASCYVEQKLK